MLVTVAVFDVTRLQQLQIKVQHVTLYLQSCDNYKHMCTTYYIPHFKNLRCSTGDQQLTSYVGGTDTRQFLLVDRLVPSVGTIIFVEVFALALSHYS